MNNIDQSEIDNDAAECQKVVKAVSQGKTFVPPPVHEPKKAKEVLAKVLPKNYVITPLSKPRLTAKRVEPQYGDATVPQYGASSEPQVPSDFQPSKQPQASIKPSKPDYVSGSGRSRICAGLIALGVAFSL
jgi:hypothetical protein